MKRLAGVLLGVVGLGLGIGILAAEAVEQQPAATAASATPAAPAASADEAKMAKWKEAATPGEAHKRLEPLVGTWSHASTWWESPEAQPQKSQGTTEATWVLGNRFVQQVVRGEMMGQPFEGIGITGYDNVKQEYASVWLDNMSTGIMASSAQFDPATNSLMEQGTFSCPITGEKHMSFRSVLKIADANSHSYEMYMKDKDGKEFKSMEIQYTRVQ
jgi:hypothetical protein